jgi:hypothetical protein
LNTITSTDGGRTWSTPRTLASAQKYLPEGKLDRADRPFVFADQSIGVAFVQAADLVGEEVFASADRGRTWLGPRTVTSSNHPGAAFPEQAVPTCCGDLTSARCPRCSVPGIVGARFTSEVPVPRLRDQHRRGADVDDPPRAPAYGMIRADPSRRGRYAILQQTGATGDPAQLFAQAAVWVTDDSGATWSGPTERERLQHSPALQAVDQLRSHWRPRRDVEFAVSRCDRWNEPRPGRLRSLGGDLP